MTFPAKKILLIVMIKIALTFSIITPNSDNEKQEFIRSKRLIWGTPLTDSQSPFNSPKWFANIYGGSTWSRFRMDWYRLFKVPFGDVTPSSVNHLCGGSMLTPKVVGTAGHCIASYVYKNKTFDRGERRNGWENYYTVFVGYFTEQDMRANPIPGSWGWSTKFLLHENYGRIYHERSGRTFMTHDFGLIVLDRDITFPKPGTRVVPAYDMSDIATEYQYINQRETICLFIGFGSYFWKSRGVYGDQSPIMMHGWRSMRSYSYCETQSRIRIRLMRFLGYDYRRVASAVCHTFFGKIRVQTMPGDSGSPVTCNNIYVGLNSRGSHVDKFRTPHPEVRRSLAWSAAIAFVMTWHSAQYRDSFLSQLKVGIAIPEVLTTEGPKPKQPLKPPVVGYFDQQDVTTKLPFKPNDLRGAKPIGSATSWISPSAVAISAVLSFYRLKYNSA